jgi:transcriptional regulator
MKRRDLAAGLALAGFGVAAEPQGQESLYIPRPHLVEDRKLLHDFMDEFAFVELVTSSPEIRITHIPVMLERGAGRYGTLYGHIARQNPQSAGLDGRQPAVVVFRGPHAYVSPSWSVKPGGGGTWNFAVVHAGGKLRAVTDKQALRDLLAGLIRKFEDEKSAYDFSKLPDSNTDPRMARIFGFAMEIERLEGKFKLGQERSEADREILLRNVRVAKPPRSFADFTASFFASLPPPKR